MSNTINLNVSPGQTRTITFNCGSTYVLDDIVFIISGEDSDSDAGLELLEEVTYTQLKSMRDTGVLVPGKFYRMTDFVTTTNTPSSALPTAGYKYKSAMHPFDLVLLAVSKYELDHRAIAILSEDDTSDYFKNCDLLKWQIWYDIENNTSRYDWAWNDDTGVGKGVIYRMIDERGNDCPYDFKNILFAIDTDATGTTAEKSGSSIKNWVFTFCESLKDKSVDGNWSAKENVIARYSVGKINVLNNIVMLGKQFNNNEFGVGCNSIILTSDSCNDNKFGNENDGHFLMNTSRTVMGYRCSGITTSDGCVGNTFGNSCGKIVLGKNCINNVFGDKCEMIIFGDTEGNYGDYVEDVIFRNGNHDINFYRSGGSPSNVLKNIYFAQGVCNTTVNSITRGNKYRTTVAMLTDGTVRIYKEDEESIHYILDNTLCIGGYPPNYLRIVNTDTVDGVVKIQSNIANTPVIYYSFDALSWDVFPVNGSGVGLSVSSKMYLKGYNSGGLSDYATGTYTNITISSSCVELDGSVQSLVDGVGWSPNGVEMYSLFSGNTTLITVARNLLPATNLVDHCYHKMFSGCSSLKNAPDLPAETLAESCYEGMFSECSSLGSVMSELPAITAKNRCYCSMFSACITLDYAPDLPAKTLDNACYMYMFKDSGLKKAPELRASLLVKECYYQMFSGCSNLIYIYCTATNILAQDCTTNWVKGVATSGNFTKFSSTTWTTGFNGIPSGWTVLTV